MNQQIIQRIQKELLSNDELWNNPQRIKALLNDLFPEDKPFMNLLFDLFVNHHIIERFDNQTGTDQQLVYQLSLDMFVPQNEISKGVSFWHGVASDEVIQAYCNAKDKRASVSDAQPALVQHLNTLSSATFGGINANNQIIRGNLALEDGEYDEANNFFELALMIDATNAHAYIGKLLSENKMHTINDLTSCSLDILQHKYYRHAIKFADDELKQTLNNIETSIRYRIQQEAFQKAYDEAKQIMIKAENTGDLNDSITAFEKAANQFEKISEYLDSRSCQQHCLESIETLKNEILYQQLKTAMKKADYDENDHSQYEAIRQQFEMIKGYKDTNDYLQRLSNLQSYISEKKAFYTATTLLSQIGYATKPIERLELYADAYDELLKTSIFPYSQDKRRIVRSSLITTEDAVIQKTIENDSTPLMQANLIKITRLIKSLKSKTDDKELLDTLANQLFSVLLKSQKPDVLYIAVACAAELDYPDLVQQLLERYEYQASIAYHNAQVYESKGRYELAIPLYQSIAEYKDSKDRLQALKSL